MSSSVSKTPFPVTCIFDTETTGIPPSDPTHSHRYAPYSKWGNQCRLLQLAWQIRGHEGELLQSYNAFVRPEDFEIPPEAAAVHGITEAFLIEQTEVPCKSARAVLEDLFEALAHHRVECLVAHNLAFDYHIIHYELRRAIPSRAEREDKRLQWEALQGYCTYKRGQRYLKDRGIRQSGKLVNYYSYFVEPWDTSSLKQTATLHRADSDVEVCQRLFQCLYPLTLE